MVQITRRISPYNHSDGNGVKYIVVHDTGNYSDSASGNANYFNGGDRQASAHYFVDSSSIWQVVEESHAAWHCGDGGMAHGIGNHNSIGIEMCKSNGDITEATIKNTLDLIRQLMSKYSVSIDRVVRHKDASGKTCPATFSGNNWARWNNFKSRISGASVSVPTPASTPESGVMGYGTIAASVLNVRDGASTSYGVIGTLSSGARVKISCKVGGWYNVFFGAHGGWIYADYVTMDSVQAPTPKPAPTPTPAPAEQYGVVTADALNVRASASTNSSIIGSLPNGERVRIGTKVGNWFNIYFGSHGGWVSADYVRID